MTERKLIKVPVTLHQKIYEIAKEEDRPMWEVIKDAIETYELYKRRKKPRKDVPTIDRISWYIIKLSMSVGAFKERPTIEHFQ